MKFAYIQDINAPQLLLIYAGWSTDAGAFAGLKCPGYDIVVVWDYCELSMPALPREYEEVVLMAWSLGVKAAELTAGDLPLTLTLAVNGTGLPDDDRYGIPSDIYRLTAERLNEQNLMKFRRRMGASALPRGERSIESLRAELLSFPTGPTPFRWDRAVISTDDAIFPPENQREFWTGRAEVTEIKSKHMPDFQSIVDAFVINKQLVETRFEKGRETYVAEADIQQRIAEHLFDLWQKHGLKREGDILEIGAGNGLFTQLYVSKMRPAKLTLWDIAPAENSCGTVERADAEKAMRHVAATSLDAVVSASTMQWFNSVGAFMEQAARVLKPGAMAVLSTFGPETFGELTAAGVVPLPYLGEEGLRRIVPQQMEVIELHSGLVTKVFDGPVDVLRHLRATGVNARPMRCSVQQLLSRYPRRRDGRVSLTYQPIYMILRKK